MKSTIAPKRRPQQTVKIDSHPDLQPIPEKLASLEKKIETMIPPSTAEATPPAPPKYASQLKRPKSTLVIKPTNENSKITAN